MGHLLFTAVMVCAVMFISAHLFNHSNSNREESEETSNDKAREDVVDENSDEYLFYLSST